MDFKRRLNLYLFGLVLGGILSYLIYGKRLTNTAWMPEARVKLRLHSTLLRTTPAAQTQLDGLHLTLATLRASLDSASVSFAQSRRTKDSLYYAVSGPVDGRMIAYTVATLRDYMVDSTATLIAVREGR